MSLPTTEWNARETKTCGQKASETRRLRGWECARAAWRIKRSLGVAGDRVGAVHGPKNDSGDLEQHAILTPASRILAVVRAATAGPVVTKYEAAAPGSVGGPQ